LERGQRGEEAFIAAVTASRVVAFDNADAKIPWLEDHLARVSTGSDIVRRQLYTTNDLVTYRPAVFVALTARTPKFRREDVAERMLILPVEELASKRPEGAILEEVQSARSAAWGSLVMELNRLVGNLRGSRMAAATSFRLADFAEFAYRAARDKADWEETGRALRRMESEQADFALAEDPLFAALDAWVHTNAARGPLDAGLLNRELRPLAEGLGAKWPYETAQALGTRLRDVHSALNKFFAVTRQQDKGRKRVLWGFAPRAALPDSFKETIRTAADAE
jgi:hypothetical protein